MCKFCQVNVSHLWIIVMRYLRIIRRFVRYVRYRVSSLLPYCRLRLLAREPITKQWLTFASLSGFFNVVDGV